MNVKAAFGMIGLGTMGRNFVLNLLDHGIVVAGYDRNPAQQERLKTESGPRPVITASSLPDFLESLSHPRRIMLLVPAGAITDAVIDELVPLLTKGDILIDGGNSHFIDTDRRIEKLRPAGIHFTGMGVSGGEEGARTGPSLMPGGNPESYAELKPILEKVAAKTKDGSCVAFVGNGSAGHYTKMVHNGIEYAIMELISEVYGILLNAGFTNTQISELFAQWNDSPLQSFLIEITAEVLRKKDDQTKNDLVDMVLDKAKQKGTGMWTSQSAMELNVPLLSIDAAVSMRYISSLKEERMAIGGNKQKILINGTDKDKLPAICFHALQFGFLLAYGQGLHLLRTASDAYNYGIEIAEVLRIWKGGCIIRSALLDGLMNVYQQQDPGNILLDKKYHEVLTALRKDCKSLLIGAVNAEIPVPAFSASLSYFDAFSTQRLSTNLLQAQRDYFGAHGYERIDKPGNFHSDWHE